MSEQRAKQLNKIEWEELDGLPELSLYIEFPIDFTGKVKKGASASVFAVLNLSCQFILAIIHTYNKISRKPAKLTYEFISETFGMSRETISKAFKTLIDRGIIERVKRSHYKIVARYGHKDYVEIDHYWFKHEWTVNGKKKRLSYARLLTLGLLKRAGANTKKQGEFTSSQARIGKALNLPRTTAGDSVRELVAANLIASVKPDGNDALRRGCSLFYINPQLYEVKHPGLNLTNLKALSIIKDKPTAEQMHARLMGDDEYKNVIERIEVNYRNFIAEIFKSHGDDTQEVLTLQSEKERLRDELEAYLKRKRIKRSVFPPGFFRTDDIKSQDNKA